MTSPNHHELGSLASHPLPRQQSDNTIPQDSIHHTSNYPPTTTEPSTSFPTPTTVPLATPTIAAAQNAINPNTLPVAIKPHIYPNFTEPTTKGSIPSQILPQLTTTLSPTHLMTISTEDHPPQSPPAIEHIPTAAPNVINNLQVPKTIVSLAQPLYTIQPPTTAQLPIAMLNLYSTELNAHQEMLEYLSASNDQLFLHLRDSFKQQMLLFQQFSQQQLLFHQQQSQFNQSLNNVFNITQQQYKMDVFNAKYAHPLSAINAQAIAAILDGDLNPDQQLEDNESPHVSSSPHIHTSKSNLPVHDNIVKMAQLSPEEFEELQHLNDLVELAQVQQFQFENSFMGGSSDNNDQQQHNLIVQKNKRQRSGITLSSDVFLGQVGGYESDEGSEDDGLLHRDNTKPKDPHTSYHHPSYSPSLSPTTTTTTTATANSRPTIHTTGLALWQQLGGIKRQLTYDEISPDFNRFPPIDSSYSLLSTHNRLPSTAGIPTDQPIMGQSDENDVTINLTKMVPNINLSHHFVTVQSNLQHFNDPSHDVIPSTIAITTADDDGTRLGPQSSAQKNGPFTAHLAHAHQTFTQQQHSPFVASNVVTPGENRVILQTRGRDKKNGEQTIPLPARYALEMIDE